MQKHQPVEPVDCPLLCGELIRDGKPAVSVHLSDVCPKMPVKCQTCEAEVVRVETQSHDCVQLLKS